MSETQQSTISANGTDGEMVDMGALLAEISARLTIVGRLPLPDAQPAATPRQDEVQIMVFRLGRLRYAVDLGHIREIVRDPAVTRIPGLPDWVLGVTNLHGDIMSVVDLGHFLSIEATAPTSRRSMIVATAADQQIGLIVDEIDVIYRVTSEHIISPPFSVEPVLVPYLRGAIERGSEFIRLLDCHRLLLGQQMQQFS
jgi:chemotaxis signal transduction protein